MVGPTISKVHCDGEASRGATGDFSEMDGTTGNHKLVTLW